MSYREQMHPTVSKAELQVFAELSKRGLTKGMITQKPIILKATIPDFLWIEKKKAIYLDGSAVHKDGDEWDLEVTALLEKRNWQVLRISYNAPLTKVELKKVMQQIEEFL